MQSFVPAFFLLAMPRPLSRLEDLLSSPVLLAAWGIALLLILALPVLMLRLRRRRVRRTYPLNPLAVAENSSAQQQANGEDDEYREQDLAEATR